MKNIDDYSQLLLPDEVCSILRITKASFYKKVWLGQIPVIKIGKLLRVNRDELMIYLDENSSNHYRQQ